MKGKKLISVIVVASVVLGTSIPVFAEENVKKAETTLSVENQAKITKEEAKKIAKGKIKEYLDYEFDESKFESRVEFTPNYYRQSGNYVWDINWNYYDQKISINLSVIINSSTGKVISVRKHEYDRTKSQPSIASITYSEAKDVVEAFMNKLMPEKKAQVKLNGDNQNIYSYGGYRSANYSFNYQRIINGLDFEGNYINIQVDGNAGKITGFDMEWSEDVNLPSSEGIIEEDKAMEIMRAETSLKLNYIDHRTKYNYGQTKDTKLVYSSEVFSNSMIDAKTGNKVNYYGIDNGKAVVKNLTDKERQELYSKAAISQTTTKEMDSSAAEEAMKAKLKGIYNSDCKVQGLTYNENSDNYDTNGKEAWTGNFIKEGEDGVTSMEGSIAIDAQTGDILSLSNYNGYNGNEEEFTPKLSWDEAYYKALDIIAKYIPDKIKEIDTEQTHFDNKEIINGKAYPQREYYFQFKRVVNGINYSNNSISVVFDAKTGAVQQIYSDWSDKVSFLDSKGAMSSEDAENLVFEKCKPKLIYKLIEKPNNNKVIEFETKLVYKLSGKDSSNISGNIDAFSGKFLDYSGNEISHASQEFLDKIKGNKYEKELTILSYQGIIDPSNFDANKTITKMDLIKMLVDAKGYNSYMLKNADSLKFSNISKKDANYGYLQRAVYYGIIENKAENLDVTQNVSREDMAKALVKLLGYENLANAKDIFLLSVSDNSEVSKDNFSYVTIAKGLGILEVENDKIRPKDNTTSMELAIGIYKVLGNIKSSK